MYDVGIVSWNAMIGGYASHGYSKDALKLFDLHDVDIVSWNAMFIGYAHNRFFGNDLDTFKHM